MIKGMFFPSDAGFFKTKHTPDETAIYIIDLVRTDDDEKLSDYCKKNHLSESYEFIKAMVNVTNKENIGSEIKNIFETFIIDNGLDFDITKKTINLGGKLRNQLIGAYSEFVSGTKTLEEMLSLLKLAMNEVAEMIGNNFSLIDGNRRSAIKTLSETQAPQVDNEEEPSSSDDASTSCCKSPCALI